MSTYFDRGCSGITPRDRGLQALVVPQLYDQRYCRELREHQHAQLGLETFNAGQGVGGESPPR